MILFPTLFRCLRQPRFLWDNEKRLAVVSPDRMQRLPSGLGLGKFVTNTLSLTAAPFLRRVSWENIIPEPPAQQHPRWVSSRRGGCLLNTSDDTIVWI